jgi:hypothetical protein
VINHVLYMSVDKISKFRDYAFDAFDVFCVRIEFIYLVNFILSQ